MAWRTAGEVRRATRGKWRTLAGDDEFRAAAAYAYEDVCAEVSDYTRFIEVCRTIPWGRVPVAIDTIARKGVLPSLSDYQGFTVVALLNSYSCVPPHLLLDALAHPKVLAVGVTPFIARHVASLAVDDLASLAAESTFDIGHPLILWTAAHARAPLPVLNLLETLCANLDFTLGDEPSTFLMLKTLRLRVNTAELSELLEVDKETFIVAAFWRLVDGRATFAEVSALLPELPYLWTFAHDCGDTPVPELNVNEQALLDWVLDGI